MANQKKSPKPTKTSGAKVKSFLSHNLNSIIFGVSITIFNLFIIILKIQSSGYHILSGQALLTYIIFFIVTALILTILYQAKKKSWPIAKIFLYCGLSLGTIYVFFLPIGGAPDEQAHFWRVYELSEGRIFSETNEIGDSGMYIPENLRSSISNKYSIEDHGYETTIEDIGVYASSDTYVFASTPADNYAPFNYLPQVIGVWIGKVIHLPLIPMMYLSRLFNMIFCIIAIYLCIKYIPIMKKTVFLVALFPMSMQSFASVSADGSILCASIALITFVIYARTKMKRRINFKDILLLTILCLTISVSKPVYAFLCPILFWIPKTKFKSNKHKIITILLIGTITLSLTLLKLYLAPIGEARFDSSSQINLILTNPIRFLGIIFENAFLMPVPYLDSAIGKNLEWLSVELFAPCVITFFIFFIFLCAEHETKAPYSLKIFAFLSFFTIVILTFVTMFIQWTEPGSSIIEGVQGRYFLPVLLLVPIFCLPAQPPSKKSLVKLNYLVIFPTLINAYALTMMFCTHI